MDQNTFLQVMEGLEPVKEKEQWRFEEQRNLTFYCVWQGQLIQMGRLVEVAMKGTLLWCRDVKGDVYVVPVEGVTVVRASPMAEKPSRTAGFV